MSGRFSRSWGLVKASASVLRSDKELLLFPLLSTIAAIVVVASFMTPVIALGWGEAVFADEDPGPVFWAWMFIFYVVQYFIIFFFNSALVGAALIRLRGGDPTVGDGLRIAFSRIHVIFGYALIAATVGLLLRMLEERLGFIGRIVVAFVGVAWTVATFLTVPVLVSRDIGPLDAVKESAALLKRTWGENLIGNAGIAVAFTLVWVVLAVVGVGVMVAAAASGSAALMVVLGALLLLAFVLTALIQAALQGIYSAALYRYAAEGEAGVGFTGDALSGAFRIKA
ncbi:MAG TPA: DUF6159 family protein [Xanthomonadaceae bacterium]|nr:DUF6159 family protein [Xanthomonadaceae bacterium]